MPMLKEQLALLKAKKTTTDLRPIPSIVLVDVEDMDDVEIYYMVISAIDKYYGDSTGSIHHLDGFKTYVSTLPFMRYSLTSDEALAFNSKFSVFLRALLFYANYPFFPLLMQFLIRKYSIDKFNKDDIIFLLLPTRYNTLLYNYINGIKTSHTNITYGYIAYKARTESKYMDYIMEYIRLYCIYNDSTIINNNDIADVLKEFIMRTMDCLLTDTKYLTDVQIEKIVDKIYLLVEYKEYNIAYNIYNKLNIEVEELDIIFTKYNKENDKYIIDNKELQDTNKSIIKNIFYSNNENNIEPSKDSYLTLNRDNYIDIINNLERKYLKDNILDIANIILRYKEYNGIIDKYIDEKDIISIINQNNKDIINNSNDNKILMINILSIAVNKNIIDNYIIDAIINNKLYYLLFKSNIEDKVWDRIIDNIKDITIDNNVTDRIKEIENDIIFNRVISSILECYYPSDIKQYKSNCIIIELLRELIDDSKLNINNKNIIDNILAIEDNRRKEELKNNYINNTVEYIKIYSNDNKVLDEIFYTLMDYINNINNSNIVNIIVKYFYKNVFSTIDTKYWECSKSIIKGVLDTKMIDTMTYLLAIDNINDNYKELFFYIHNNYISNDNYTYSNKDTIKNMVKNTKYKIEYLLNNSDLLYTLIKEYNYFILPYIPLVFNNIKNNYNMHNINIIKELINKHTQIMNAYIPDILDMLSIEDLIEIEDKLSQMDRRRIVEYTNDNSRIIQEYKIEENNYNNKKEYLFIFLLKLECNDRYIFSIIYNNIKEYNNKTSEDIIYLLLKNYNTFKEDINILESIRIDSYYRIISRGIDIYYYHRIEEDIKNIIESVDNNTYDIDDIFEYRIRALHYYFIYCTDNNNIINKNIRKILQYFYNIFLDNRLSFIDILYSILNYSDDIKLLYDFNIDLLRRLYIDRKKCTVDINIIEVLILLYKNCKQYKLCIGQSVPYLSKGLNGNVKEIKRLVKEIEKYTGEDINNYL